MRRGSPARQIAGRFLALTALLAAPAAAEAPVYPQGTIFVSPDIVTTDTPTAFLAIEYAGTGAPIMFDRRSASFAPTNAFLFDATYSDGLKLQVQVNTEFGSEAAATLQASRYAKLIGQLPVALRTRIETIWVHRGMEPLGGGNQNVLVHTGLADAYARRGILEEALFHEATHTSLDADHANSAGWRAAQQADPSFVSPYARQNAQREDLAETVLLWFAIRHAPDSLSAADTARIKRQIPGRLAYLDEQMFKMVP